MKLFYFHVAGDVPESDLPEVAVVIDVLRATTTIAWALANGAESINVFSDIDELKKRAFQCPKHSRLLIGERGGERLEGFDLGNSPIDVVRDLVESKTLFMSTTNGTKSLARVSSAKNLFTMALPNRKAVATRILELSPDQVWIIGSGWEGSYSLEDSFAAGALGEFLLKNGKNPIDIGNDELMSALTLWEQWKDARESCLRQASHGRRLVGLGDHDADFKCCSQLDNLSVVPTQVETGVLRAG